MVRTPCVSLTRLEPDVHTDATVLRVVLESIWREPHKTICLARLSQAGGAPGGSTISAIAQAAQVPVAAAAAAALGVCLRMDCGSPWQRVWRGSKKGCRSGALSLLSRALASPSEDRTQERPLRAASWLRSVATSSRARILMCVPCTGCTRYMPVNFGRAGDCRKGVSWVPNA